VFPYKNEQQSTNQEPYASSWMEMANIHGFVMKTNVVSQ